MDCLEFRRQVASERTRTGDALARHASECAACATYSGDVASLDRRIAHALKVPVPGRLQSFSIDDREVLQNSVVEKAAARGLPSFSGGGWLAIAASVLIAVLVSVGIWNNAKPAGIGSELVAHVRHEPMSLLPVAEPVSTASVDHVLRRTGARVGAPLGTVTYIKTCPFRGRQVAHMVIEGSTGPVTLLLLPHVAVTEAETFEEDGLRGAIVPVGEGSVAIIGSETEPLDSVEKIVSSAVAWQI